MSDIEHRAAARTSAPPIPFRWTGEAMEPVGRFGREADRYFVVGQVYSLIEVQERSGKSHRHYFASLNEAWASLPEHLAPLFPTMDHLRRHALCRAGFCEAKQVACESGAKAVTLHKLLGSDYDLASVNGNVVTFFTAHSQSYRTADQKEFQAQKDAVLEVVAEMIGVAPEVLAHNAERHAA